MKIVFDTNSCRSDASRHDQFFGYRNQLEKLALSSEIIIPEMVIDEIAAQKRRSLIKKKSEHLSNPFLQLSGVNPREVKDIDINNVIAQLVDSETINFTLRDVTDKLKTLAKIREWSIYKQPPFLPNDSAGDKGFKDAYIACTIEEILDECDDEYIIFFTKDDQLIAKFEKNSRVKIVAEFEEASMYIVEEFIDEYMLEKIKAELGIEKVEIVDSWLNIDENWVIEIADNDKTQLIIIDSQAREILDKLSNQLDLFVQMLTSSSSFQQTHTAIEELTALLPFLNQKRLVDIINAGASNDQIALIAKDEDVKQFYLSVYMSVSSLIDSSVILKIKELFLK